VTPISVATNRPEAAIPVGLGPDAIAIASDGSTAYVANFISGNVTPIDTATRQPGPDVQVGLIPAGAAAT
jgi:YVTN family beta-propeller protein